MSLEGTRQGFLQIKGRHKKGNVPYYHVVCDCGNEKEMTEWNLKGRKATSCGCKGRFVKKGDRFGMLTAKEKVSNKLWRCECDCGNKNVLYPAGSLLQHNNQSCGCKKQANNRKKRKDSSTGAQGVCYSKRRNKYIAYINKSGKRHHLGYFETVEQAKEARLLAEKALFTEYQYKNEE